MKLKRKAGSKLTSSKAQAATDKPVKVDEAKETVVEAKEAPASKKPAAPKPKKPAPKKEKTPEPASASEVVETPPTSKPSTEQQSAPGNEQGAVPPALKFDDVPAQKPVVTDVPQQKEKEPPTSAQQPEVEDSENMTLSESRTRGVAEDFRAQQALGSLIVDQQEENDPEVPPAVTGPAGEPSEAQKEYVSKIMQNEEKKESAPVVPPAPLGFTPPPEGEDAQPATTEGQEKAVVAEPETEFTDPFANEAQKPPMPPEPDYGEDAQAVEAATEPEAKEEQPAPSGFTQEVSEQNDTEKPAEAPAPSSFTAETQENAENDEAPAPFVPPITEEAPREPAPQGFVPPTDEPEPTAASQGFVPPSDAPAPEEEQLEKDDVQSLGDEPEPFVPPKTDEISSSGDSSVLPWMEGADNNGAAENDGWEIDGVTDKDTPAAQDIYNDIGASGDAEKQDEDKTSDTLPPWTSGSAEDGPPILPGQDEVNTGPQIVKGDFLDVRKIVLLGGAVALLMGAYLVFVANQEKTTEFLARWTGTLDEVSQEVVTQEQAQTAEVEIGEPTPMPEEPPFEPVTPQEMAMNDVEAMDDVMVEPDPEILEPPLIEEEKAAEVSEPEEPQNGSLFDSIQSKFAEARAKKEQERTGQAPTEDSGEAPKENVLFEGEELKRQLEQELAAYRQTLAAPSRNAVKPKPQEFFNQVRSGQPTAPTPTLAPPKTASAQQAGVPQENLIPNPQNLPIVGEPKAQQKPGVRTLEEFDVAMFEPKHERVRIPKGISPSLRARTFPEMELLSLVPGRGIIAAVEGREGILLVGEVIKGWELLAVYEEYAEFQNAGRRYTLTLQ